MKRLHYPLLCTLALSLAACGTSAVPSGLTDLARLPDPSCVTQSGADWAPSSVSVNRFNTPTAPNTDVQFDVYSPATVTARVVTPLGASVSQSNFTASSSGLVPVTVTVSLANGPGTYYVTLYWKSSSQGPNCPEVARTLAVTAY